MTTLKKVFAFSSFFFITIINTGETSIKYFIDTFDNVQRLPTVLKIYIANTFILQSYIEEKVSYTTEESLISEPFIYGQRQGMQLRSRSLDYMTKDSRKEIKTREGLTNCYVNLVGPNKEGFFIIDSTIKNLSHNDFEYSLIDDLPAEFFITALYPDTNAALSINSFGRLYKHTFLGNNTDGKSECFTEKLNHKLPADNKLSFKQLLITDTIICVARTDDTLYLLPINQENYKRIIITDLLSANAARELWKKLHNECDDSLSTRFSHIECTHRFPDHLFVELCISSTLPKTTIKKNMIYHIPSSKWLELEPLKDNNCITRWRNESLYQYTRKLHATSCEAKNKIRNIIHHAALQKKTKVMLQAYLILSAANLWNKKNIKSKEDAGEIIKRLKKIPYAGCIYKIEKFTKIFDEMRKQL